MTYHDQQGQSPHPHIVGRAAGVVVSAVLFIVVSSALWWSSMLLLYWGFGVSAGTIPSVLLVIELLLLPLTVAVTFLIAIITTASGRHGFRWSTVSTLISAFIATWLTIETSWGAWGVFVPGLASILVALVLIECVKQRRLTSQ